MLVFLTNTCKNIKQFLITFKNGNIEFVKNCCLLGLKISTDLLASNIEGTIQTFYGCVIFSGGTLTGTLQN